MSTPGELKYSPSLSQRPRGDAGLLGEFALRALERRLAAVELAGGQFGDPAAGRVPELPQQADAAVGVERDDRCAAGVVGDLEFGDPAVRQADPLEVQGQDACP